MTVRRLPSQLFLRERLPQGEPRGCVLFVHGATVGSVLFDLPKPGLSILDVCASEGLAAYAVDLRGYGHSPRSPEMDASPEACSLQCTGTDAIEDISEAVQFIVERHQRVKLRLAGGSWGSLTSARFAIAYPNLVEQLILIAPLYGTRNEGWLQTLADPSNPKLINPQLGGYRFVTAIDLLARWDPEIAPGDRSKRRDPRVFAAMVQAEIDADPRSPRVDAFRVPNGTLHELFEVFSGRPIYNPSAISCPTVLIRGECDLTSTAADVDKLQSKLSTAPVATVTLSDAGHFMQAERGAPLLHRCLVDILRHDLTQLNVL
jgi:pimeloyl-ACP methyl ester carboxylesterase